MLYPREYEIAKESLQEINHHFKIQLPIDEIGFIAMHIVNASIDENITNVYEITKITKSILYIVRYHFNLHINEDELNYSRFITHLKFFGQRLINHQNINEVTDESLLLVLKQKYPNVNNCVDKIVDFIRKNYEYTLTNDERIYLMLHIARLIK